MPKTLSFWKQARVEHWKSVSSELDRFVKEAAEPVACLYESLFYFPAIQNFPFNLYYQPDEKVAFVGVVDRHEKTAQDLGQHLSQICDVIVADAVQQPEDYGEAPWIFVKKSFDPMSILAQLGAWKDGPTNKPFGGPSPLAAALSSGLLGAGAGYGAGWLGEHLLPSAQFAPGALRRTGAIAGVALGAAPALWWGSLSQRHNPDVSGAKAWLSGWPFSNASVADHQPPYGNIDLGDVSPGNIDLGDVSLKAATEALREQLPGCEPHPAFLKAAGEFDGSQTGLDEADQTPMIPRMQFNQSVWEDQQTPLPLRSATTGLVDAASMSRGGIHMVSPLDIARIGIGMGTGLASGLIVGKTLGALAGLRPESQKVLQQAGIWTGVLANTIPMIFGR